MAGETEIAVTVETPSLTPEASTPPAPEVPTALAVQVGETKAETANNSAELVELQSTVESLRSTVEFLRQEVERRPIVEVTPEPEPEPEREAEPESSAAVVVVPPEVATEAEAPTAPTARGFWTRIFLG